MTVYDDVKAFTATKDRLDALLERTFKLLLIAHRQQSPDVFFDDFYAHNPDGIPSIQLVGVDVRDGERISYRVPAHLFEDGEELIAWINEIPKRLAEKYEQTARDKAAAERKRLEGRLRILRGILKEDD